MSKTFDWNELDSLLIAGCKGSECAAYFGMHPDSLYRKVSKEKNCDFSAYLQEKHSNGDALLKAVQYSKAIGKSDKGDNTLLIWLGKCRLKQKEHQEIVPMNNESLENLFGALPTLEDNAKLKEENERIRKELHELKLKAGYEHHTSQEAVQHMGGGCSIGENICEHSETD